MRMKVMTATMRALGGAMSDILLLPLHAGLTAF